MREEIGEQPAVAARLLDEGRPQIESIAETLTPRLADRAIDAVVIAARGSSDHAALYAQYVFGAFLRLPVALATPSLISIYGIEPRLDRALVIGISQSGRSPDIVETLAAARRQGAPTIAITNDRLSDLATAADHHIDLLAGPELSVAATKTYTAELLAVALLGVALERPAGGGPDRERDLAAVPAALSAALATEPQATAVAATLAKVDRTIVIGRGYEYATARELALKLKEVARLAADPYSAADFLHGPVTLVEPGFPVLVLAPSGAASTDVDALLVRLVELGVEPIVVSDRPEVGDAAPAIALPAGLPDWLMPIASIVPGQLLALHLALTRGLDPETPRWIGKVTLTR